MTMDVENERQRSILICTLFALVAEIPANLRAVSVDWTKNEIILYFYFDGEYSANDREDAECIATEIIAHFNEDTIETMYFDIPEPEPIPRLGKQFVFARKGTQFRELRKTDVFIT